MFGRKRIPVIPPTETNSTQKLLIFVCTSSTCRSPMAEQFGIRFLKQHNLTSDYTIISRSLTDKYETPGSPASAPGIEVLMEDYGLDMKEHRSCLLKNSDVDEAHAIIGVSQSHVNWISQEFQCDPSKLFCFPHDIPDPWHGPKEEYRACAHTMEPMVNQTLLEIMEKDGQVLK